jgi:hypothetical protein
MSYGLRSIAFVAELIHPPVKHDPQTLQKLHSLLFGSAVCSYRDFKLTPMGAVLSNSAGGVPGQPVSQVNVLGDRIQIREEQTGLSREDFGSRLEHLARAVLTNLPVGMYVAQQFAVRSVLNLHGGDARAFMLKTVFGFDGDILEAFGSEPSLAGLRLAFPPANPGDGLFNVRIESFTKDNRSVFLENVATYGTPVNLEQLDMLDDRFEATYEYLQDRLVGFVAQFDAEEQD